MSSEFPNNHSHTHSDEQVKYVYFVENQILLCVEHETDWLLDDKGDLDTEFLFSQLNINDEIPCLPSRNMSTVPPIRFAQSENREITCFPVEWDTYESIGDRLTMIMNSPQYQHNESFPLVDRLGRSGKLISVIPNWYLGATGHTGIGTHGPAQPPWPVDASNKLTMRHALGQPSLQSKTPCDNLDIFVLDTVPSPTQISGAWCRWHSWLMDYEKLLSPFTLQDSLTYKTLSATYHYAPEDAFNDIHKDALVGFYKLPDHGLFIAGIIHSLVPDAQIHVIQVLNDYGVGALLDFARGFNKVSSLMQADRKAIINCSFVLAFPDENATEMSFQPSQEVLDTLRATTSNPTVPHHNKLKRDTELFMQALQQSLANDTVIVACVGNDSEREDEHNPTIIKTRYPAAMSNTAGISPDKFVAVGALKRKGGNAEPAKYSNEVPANGLYAFGGDYDETGQGEGIVSVFTSDFASIPKQNEKGLAKWAGTSFATPIVTSRIALECCTDRSPVETLASIRQSASKLVSQRQHEVGVVEVLSDGA